VSGGEWALRDLVLSDTRRPAEPPRPARPAGTTFAELLEGAVACGHVERDARGEATVRAMVDELVAAGVVRELDGRLVRVPRD
jgi:hypothetical protein